MSIITSCKLSMKPLEVLSQLEYLGFFKYVSPEKLAASKQQVYAELAASGTVDFFADLNRVFWIDGEDIYEAGGLLDQMKCMLDLFGAMNINLVINNYVEEFDENITKYTKRTIEINGKTYDGSKAGDWGEAFLSGIGLIEEILQDHNRVEKVYGLFWDQSSTLILLDTPLFEYLKKVVPPSAIHRPIDFERIIGEN